MEAGLMKKSHYQWDLDCLINSRFYPYHFVRTILSVTFCPLPFCPITVDLLITLSHTNTHTLMYWRVCVCLYARVRACVCPCRVRGCTHTQTYIHIHTHTRTHINTLNIFYYLYWPSMMVIYLGLCMR